MKIVHSLFRIPRIIEIIENNVLQHTQKETIKIEGDFSKI